MPSIGQAALGNTLGGAVIRISIDTSAAISGLKAAQFSLGGFVRSAVAVYGIGRAIKAAASEFVKFDETLRNTWTLIDDMPIEGIQKVGREVRALAKEYNVTAVAAQQSMYEIYSALFYGSDAMRLLEESMRGAAAGVAELFTTMDMFTTILNAYQMSADEVGKVNDIVFQAVKYGKVTMSEMTNQFGRLAGMAAPLGASLEEMAAGISTLTRQGINADWAVTALRQTLMQMARPTKDLEKLMSDLGYSTGRDIIAANGFAGALGLIVEQAAKSGVNMEDLFSNVRALLAVLPLTSNAAEGFAQDLSRMKNAAGVADQAFAKAETSIQYKMNQLNAQVKDLAISFGQLLTPSLQVFIGAIQSVTAVLNPLITILKSFGGDIMLGIAASAGAIVLSLNALKRISTTLKLAEMFTPVKTALASLMTTMQDAALVGIPRVGKVITNSLGKTMVYGLTTAKQQIRNAAGQFAGYETVYGVGKLINPANITQYQDRLGKIRNVNAAPNLVFDVSKNAVVNSKTGELVDVWKNTLPGKFGISKGLWNFGLISAGIASVSLTIKALSDLNVSLGKISGGEGIGTAIKDYFLSALGGTAGGAVIAALFGKSALMGGAIGLATATTISLVLVIKTILEDVSNAKEVGKTMAETLFSSLDKTLSMTYKGSEYSGGGELGYLGPTPEEDLFRAKAREQALAMGLHILGPGEQRTKETDITELNIQGMAEKLSEYYQVIYDTVTENGETFTKITAVLKNETSSMQDLLNSIGATSILNIKTQESLATDLFNYWSENVDIAASYGDVLDGLIRSHKPVDQLLAQAIEEDISERQKYTNERFVSWLTSQYESSANAANISLEQAGIDTSNYSSLAESVINTTDEFVNALERQAAGISSISSTDMAKFTNNFAKLKDELFGELTDDELKIPAFVSMLSKMRVSFKDLTTDAQILIASIFNIDLEKLSNYYKTSIETIYSATMPSELNNAGTIEAELQRDYILVRDAYSKLGTLSATAQKESITNVTEIIDKWDYLIEQFEKIPNMAAKGYVDKMSLYVNAFKNLFGVLDKTAESADDVKDAFENIFGTGLIGADTYKTDLLIDIESWLKNQVKAVEEEEKARTEVSRQAWSDTATAAGNSILKMFNDVVGAIDKEVETAFQLGPSGEQVRTTSPEYLEAVSTSLQAASEELARTAQNLLVTSSPAPAGSGLLFTYDVAPANLSVDSEAVSSSFADVSDGAKSLADQLTDSVVTMTNLPVEVIKPILTKVTAQMHQQYIDIVTRRNEPKGISRVDEIINETKTKVDSITAAITAQNLAEGAKAVEAYRSFKSRMESFAQALIELEKDPNFSQSEEAMKGIAESLAKIESLFPDLKPIRGKKSTEEFEGKVGAVSSALSELVGTLLDANDGINTITKDIISALSQFAISLVSAAAIQSKESGTGLVASMASVLGTSAGWTMIFTLGLSLLGSIINWFKELEQKRIEEIQKASEELIANFDSLRDAISSAIDAIISFASASEYATRIQEGMSVLIEKMSNAIFGFLSPFAAIFGYLQYQYERMALEVEKTVEKVKSINNLNWPSGWKVERIRYAASIPGQPPIEEEEEEEKTAEEELADKFQWVSDSLGAFGGSIFAFVDTLIGWFGDIGGAWEEISPQIIGLIDAVLATVLEILKPFKEWIVSVLIPDIGLLAVALTALWKDEIGPFLRDKVFTKIGEWGKQLYEFIKTNILPFLQSTVWPFLRDTLWPFAEKVIGKLVTKFEDLIRNLEDHFGPLMDYLIALIEEWIDRLFGGIDNFNIFLDDLQILNDKLKEHGKTLGDAFREAKEHLGVGAAELTAALVASGGDFEEAFKSLGITDATAVNKFMNDVFGRDWMTDVQNLADAFKAAEESVRNAANSIDDAASGSGGSYGGGSGTSGGSTGGSTGGYPASSWGGLDQIIYTTLKGTRVSAAQLFSAAGWSPDQSIGYYRGQLSSGKTESEILRYINQYYVPNLHVGGTVMETGIARVKRGEFVFNPSMINSPASRQQMVVVETNVNMDGYMIMRQVDKHRASENRKTSAVALPGVI